MVSFVSVSASNTTNGTVPATLEAAFAAAGDSSKSLYVIGAVQDTAASMLMPTNSAVKLDKPLTKTDHCNEFSEVGTNTILSTPKRDTSETNAGVFTPSIHKSASK